MIFQKLFYGVLIGINIFSAVTASDYFTDTLKHIYSQKDTSQKSECDIVLEKYFADLKSSEKWALYMSDATVKQIPSDSFYEGNWMLAGSYDQCLSIRTQLELSRNTSDGLRTEIWGKYCTVEYPIRQFINKETKEELEMLNLINDMEPNLLQKEYLFYAINITAGICIPHVCKEEQIYRLLQRAHNLTKSYLEFDITGCETHAPQETKPWSLLDRSFICFILIMIFIISASTCYEFQIEKSGTKSTRKFLLAFSLISNTRSLFSVDSSPSLSCLAGIRVLSILWIILHHAPMVYAVVPLRNFVQVVANSTSVESMLISNAIMSVDTFFCLSGLVMVYSYLEAWKNRGEGFNVLKHWIHRYVRITPALAVELYLHVSVLRHLGNGPQWPRVEGVLVGNCQASWWAVLLHIQNFISPNRLCMLQSWYISTDFQLYLISPLILLPLKNWGPKLKATGLILCLGLSVAAPFAVGYAFEIHGLQAIAQLKNPYYHGWYYENFVTRSGPWFVGIWFGHLLFHRNENILINKWLKINYVYWLVMMISVGIIILITIGPMVLYSEYDRTLHSIFLATHRLIWAFPVCFIIYACTINPKRIINRFLSHPIFQILSRLTYCMYILHVLLFFLKTGQVRQPPYGTSWNSYHDFIGTTIDTIVLSIIWTLCFEIPFIRIEKLLLGKKTVVKSQKD